jgi:hypothetical protein
MSRLGRRVLFSLCLAALACDSQPLPGPAPDAAAVGAGGTGAGGAGGKPPEMQTDLRGGSGGRATGGSDQGEEGGGGSRPPGDAGLPGDAATPDTRPPDPASTPLGPTPLRRMTAAQYRRTVRDLFGTASLQTPFPREHQIHGFEWYAASQAIDGPTLQAFLSAAAEVTSMASTSGKVPTCAGPDSALCVRNFLGIFGQRAYRRPLTDAEIQRYLTLFDQAAKVASPAQAMDLIARAMLLSPNFLYFPEVRGKAIGLDRLQLDDWAIATRLSYLIWGSTPDGVLFDVASTGRLQTAEQIQNQVRRMLSDPKARDGTHDFFRQWLQMERVKEVTRDPMLFPGWNERLAASATEEGLRFIDNVLFNGDRRLGTLLTSPVTFVDPLLAAHYGLKVDGPGWTLVNQDPAQRGGLLTQAWFLAGHAANVTTGAPSRGVFVRGQLLCQDLPAPPVGIPPAPAPRPGTTARQSYEASLTEAACASCHVLMDDLHFAFENYDPVGRYRTVDNGLAIDASGMLVGTDVDGPFKNGLELDARLARSERVRACLAQRRFEGVLGRDAVDLDRPRLQLLEDALTRSDGDLQELTMALVSSDSFRQRPLAGLAVPVQVGPGPDPTATLTLQKMLLDFLLGEIQQLRVALSSPEDRLLLDFHLSGLRDYERRLQ